jgi:hypothetical protein
MQDQQHKNVGRSPQRSEAVSGDDAKGLTPISVERTVQPEAVAPTTTARSLPRPKLSLPLPRVSKSESGSIMPDQA